MQSAACPICTRLLATTIREFTKNVVIKMTGPERFHREDPERTAPRRETGSIDRADPWSAKAPLFRGDRTEDDAVDQGVSAAYRVMDEHLREGRRTAERVGNRRDQEGPPGRRSIEDIRTLTHRIVSIYADSIPILFDFIHSLGGSLLSGYRDYGAESSADYIREEGGPAISSGRRRGDDTTHFTMEVSSNRRLRISVDLADPDNSNLVVPALVDLDPAKSPLRQISFITNPRHRRRALSIVIPNDQPIGIYTGAIVDERTGVACGLLGVEIIED
jgi:hypothetical protein